MDDWSVLITRTERVYCAVRAGYLNVVQVNLIFKGLITDETNSVLLPRTTLVSCGTYCRCAVTDGNNKCDRSDVFGITTVRCPTPTAMHTAPKLGGQHCNVRNTGSGRLKYVHSEGVHAGWFTLWIWLCICRGIQIRLVVFKFVSWYSNSSRGGQIRLSGIQICLSFKVNSLRQYCG